MQSQPTAIREGCRSLFILPWLCAAFLAAMTVAPARMPTAEEAGIPARLRTTVAGSVILKSGETTVLRMGQRGGRDLDTKAAFSGTIDRMDNANWTVSGPGVVVNQGVDTATVRGSGSGKGYIQGFRPFTYRENGEEKRGVLVQTWIMVVNETGRVTDDDTASAPPPADGHAADIPRAVITGRAVMRGTDQGVPNAYIELIGDKAGTISANWTTGPDGRFTITADNLLATDRYEIFVRRGSANVERADSFNEDLWPVYRYQLKINRDNCRNLNVGRIEMASVQEMWGGNIPADRPPADITPKPQPDAPAPEDQMTQGIIQGQSTFPWEIPGANIRIFTAEPPKTDDEEDTGQGHNAMSIDYKGYVEVDFHLKASMTLKLKGDQVTGELYAPAVSGPNVRLPGARMQLQGQLAGGWEEGGRITGECSGHILWPGAQPEARAGQLQIHKVGNEVHLRSTGFYYNRYIFGAKGIKYAAGAIGGAGGAPVNSVVILIDASNSMRDNKMASAKATARQRIAALGPETELAVIAFSGNNKKFPFAMMDDAGRAAAQAAVDEISVSGGTPLADGIRDAGNYMRTQARGQRLTLIILSDGAETAGGDPPAEVRRLNDMSVNW
ncbi:MAG: VWA domain-containing protein [Kiritimatiellia bacterium]